MTSIPSHLSWKQDQNVLIHLSTKDATDVSTDRSTYELSVGGNCMNQTLSKIVAAQIYVPNIFPNVKEGYNTVDIEIGAMTYPTTIPIGQYTATEFATAFTTAAQASTGFGTLTMTFNGTSFVLTNTDPGDSYLLYFTNFNVGRVVGASDTATVLDSGGTTTLGLPNLGGERLVHIRSKRLAPSNMLHSKQDVSRNDDVCFTVPLADYAEYGATYVYQPGAIQLADIEYVGDGQSVSNIDIQLVDDEMQPLSLPANYHVDLILKGYHAD